MKNTLILLVGLAFCSHETIAQSIGHSTVTFIDSSRNNRQIATEIYYPATTSGNNTTISTGAFPIIVFGHGFVMAWSSYQNFWETLVPEGYILVFPKTESSFSPSHAEFGADFRFLIKKIKMDGAGVAIPSTSIGTTSAIMGHSMGGGSSFLAAENNTDISTLVAFAAANTNPSSITASKQVTVPTLSFSGGNDCVTPPSQHQDHMHDFTAAKFKTQVYITGGGHCYFANSNFNCSFGEATCSPSPTITREEQQSTVNELLKLWLSYFLKGECAKAQEFQNMLSGSSKITFRQSQSIACTSRTAESYDKQNSIAVFPNPSQESITLELKQENIESILFYDITKKEVSRHTLTSPLPTVLMNISSLPSGIYFINVNNTYWTKFWKK